MSTEYETKGHAAMTFFFIIVVIIVVTIVIDQSAQNKIQKLTERVEQLWTMRTGYSE